MQKDFATISASIKEIQKTLDFSPSEGALLFHLIFDFSLLTGILFLFGKGNFGAVVLADFLLPVLFFRFFGLMHECVHSSASHFKFVNEIIGCVAGAFCFLPYLPWKLIHLPHHRWAGNINKDPVMRIVREFNPQSRGAKILNFFWRTWIPAMAFLQHTVFWLTGMQHAKGIQKKREYIALAASYGTPALIYASLYKFGFINLKIIPGIILYLMLVEIVNLPHHLKVTHFKGEESLPASLQFQVSRTCVYPKWFSRIVLNNFNYHAEHHLFPRLPWYRLDKVQAKTSQVIGDHYNQCKNNEWVLENRKNTIASVLESAAVDKKNDKAVA